MQQSHPKWWPHRYRWATLKMRGAMRHVTVCQHVCFPSLPPMLLCMFKSRLGLESSGFGLWHFLKLITRGFLRAVRFPPFLHRLNGSANKIKVKQNVISTLSNLIAELSPRTTWHVTSHVAHDKRSMCCTWFAHDCARATGAYVLETVCGAVRRLSKILNCAFELLLLLLLLRRRTAHFDQAPLQTPVHQENFLLIIFSSTTGVISPFPGL